MLESLVLSQVGVDFDGPYLALDDFSKGSRELFRPEGHTFTLKRHPERFCIGSYDLVTQEGSLCEWHQELLVDQKETMCPACAEKTGFNPSFYHGGGIPSQQRAYNETPHIVYLAYFSPAYLKVGITSAARGQLRLLEQGARSAMVLKTFDTAYAARALEERLCALPGIYESLRVDLKCRLLTTEKHDPAEAADVLAKTVESAFKMEPTDPLNLDPYYSKDPSVLSGFINVPDNPDDSMVAGTCVGIVGTVALMQQHDRVYEVNLKDYVSHRVEYLADKVLYEYSAPPEQASLF